MAGSHERKRPSVVHKMACRSEVPKAQCPHCAPNPMPDVVHDRRHRA